MDIVISGGNGIPIYEQIKEQIRASIVGGELREGEMLPSTRQLATQLRVSVITTMRAYAELEKENLVTPMQGKGFYVAALDQGLLRDQALQDISAHFQAALREARYSGIRMDELKNMLDELGGADFDDKHSDGEACL